MEKTPRFAPWERLLICDCVCAFAGALAYFVFFDILIEDLGIPRAVAGVQLGANTLYGIAGLWVWGSGSRRRDRFRGLATMNLAYAFFIAVVAVVLAAGPRPPGTLLLLAESVFIAALGLRERTVLAAAA